VGDEVLTDMWIKYAGISLLSLGWFAFSQAAVPGRTDAPYFGLPLSFLGLLLCFAADKREVLTELRKERASKQA
jgi:hypothetical protein